jgi:site-specific DNA recombinase
MRHAIYARYSSDLQNANSIDDQLRLCRERVAQLGGTVAGVYTDAAISGASTLNRPGLQHLLEDARAGLFDRVMAEALDRLSRDQEDVAGIFKRLAYGDIGIFTLSEGEVSELHIGLKGTMNALFLKDLAAKVKRGQRGCLESGRIPGGLCYGYRVALAVNGSQVERGRREIVPEEAAIIRRIFKEYVVGISPRRIAHRLNAEGVKGPRGGRWMTSAIQGNRARRNGLLYNEMYIGRVVYNRNSFRKDPETGKRVSRLNLEKDWKIFEAPALRILSDEEWQAAQNFRRVINYQISGTKRAKHILSGLLKCGVCGGAYTLGSADRFRCTVHRESGDAACTNGRTIAPAVLESRLFKGLETRFLGADAFAHYVKIYREERVRLKADAERHESTRQRELNSLNLKINRMVAAIADGTDTPAMRGQLKDMEARAGDLRRLPVVEGNVVDLHPNIAEVYRAKVAELRTAMDQGEEGRAKVARALRSILTEIRITPENERGRVHIDLCGWIPSLLQFAASWEQEPVAAGTVIALVAGGGFEPPTFRL